ncbi:MAG: type II secretion system protein M [Rhodoferax sp.]|jgi:MSHA biogenesis protein MshJ|nr:type II secretion system protein M [Rhodoferax sp.]
MNKYLETLTARLDALSLRERIFLFLSVLVVCAAVLDALWLSPAQTQHKQLMLRFDKQSQELNRLREVVRASSQTGASAAGSQGTLVQLQAEIDQTELAVHRLLPPPEAAPLVQAMSHLLRRYPGLTLVKTTALAAGTSLTSAAASKDLPSGLKRQGMEVTVAGNYADLTRFVSTIEAAMPYVRWGLMTLKTTDDQTAPQLTLQLFLLTEVPS